jgi:hypothetical protein
MPQPKMVSIGWRIGQTIFPLQHADRAPVSQTYPNACLVPIKVKVLQDKLVLFQCIDYREAAANPLKDL